MLIGSCMAEKRSGWTKIFRKKDLLKAEDSFLAQFVELVASIFEGGDEQDSFDNLRGELRQLFQCDDVSLFAFDPNVHAFPAAMSSAVRL